MSVTILNEIDKADLLVAGLKKHLAEVKQLGISAEAIDRLSKTSGELRRKDEEVDALRRQATLKGHENRELLADIKAQMMEMKRLVKSRYPQHEWLRYGVQDKR